VFKPPATVAQSARRKNLLLRRLRGPRATPSALEPRRLGGKKWVAGGKPPSHEELSRAMTAKVEGASSGGARLLTSRGDMDLRRLARTLAPPPMPPRRGGNFLGVGGYKAAAPMALKNISFEGGTPRAARRDRVAARRLQPWCLGVLVVKNGLPVASHQATKS